MIILDQDFWHKEIFYADFPISKDTLMSEDVVDFLQKTFKMDVKCKFCESTNGNFILDCCTPSHETLFRIKYSEYIIE